MASPDNSSLNVLRGEEAGALLIEPMSKASAALRVSTVIQTNQTSYRVPKIVQDPTAAWVGESEEIPESDLKAENVRTTPAKVASIVYLPNELAEDTDPAALDIAADRMVQGCVVKIDNAFYRKGPAEGSAGYEEDRPKGLADIAEADLSYLNLDPTLLDTYVDAIAEAEAHGAELTAWAMHPDTAKVLAKVKKSAGSNEPLLGAGIENGVGRQILGLPVDPSTDITPGTVWGIPKRRVLTVVRKDFEVAASPHYRFNRDMTAVRVIARVGFLFPSTKSIVKVAKK